MKYIFINPLFLLLTATCLNAQSSELDSNQEKQIISLIEQYGLARSTKDSAALKEILVQDIDQLVSTGEWRRGIDKALEGMGRSSTQRPGSRSLTVDHVRLLNSTCAIADARYEIENEDGSVRKMWSTFLVVHDSDQWKIAAIRNMLPAD